MQHSEIVTTLSFIKPKSLYVLDGTNLTWLDENQTEPTEAEIKAGWVAYQAAQTAKAEAKTAAQAKLAALGLTVEDLSALGL
jgi:hypothetical protein